MRSCIICLIVAFAASGGDTRAQERAVQPEIVRFTNSSQVLGGELFKPAGRGPFPAVLYNHGSAPGMLNSQASHAIGPLFVRAGWVFFMPYRRGHLSQSKLRKVTLNPSLNLCQVSAPVLFGCKC